MPRCRSALRLVHGHAGDGAQGVNSTSRRVLYSATILATKSVGIRSSMYAAANCSMVATDSRAWAMHWGGVHDFVVGRVEAADPGPRSALKPLGQACPRQSRGDCRVPCAGSTRVIARRRSARGKSHPRSKTGCAPRTGPIGAAFPAGCRWSPSGCWGCNSRIARVRGLRFAFDQFLGRQGEIVGDIAGHGHDIDACHGGKAQDRWHRWDRKVRISSAGPQQTKKLNISASLPPVVMRNCSGRGRQAQRGVHVLGPGLAKGLAPVGALIGHHFFGKELPRLQRRVRGTRCQAARC